jgi:hypothetical protein
MLQARITRAQDEVNAQNFYSGHYYWQETYEVPDYVQLPEPSLPSLGPTSEALPDAKSAEPELSIEMGPTMEFDTRAVQPTPTPTEIRVNADWTARAAVVGDTTRLANFAKGTFLPSAIPARGQPFFGSDPRANLQGSGSAFSLSARAPRTANFDARMYAEVSLEDFSISTADAGDTAVIVREVYGTLNRLKVGISDSEFSDPSAMPEVLDRAGPNARITVFDAGVGEGQGLLSYTFLSDEPEGFDIIGSIEQAIPEINSPPGDEPFAHVPDLVVATQYVEGDYISVEPCGTNPKFYERWHLQWANVVRDLGSELPAGDDQREFGWGTALSGAVRFPVNPRVRELDRIMFSAAYGHGISHYITDLNAADDTGDAVINAAGSLEALPAFAAYVAYTHQWTDLLRSTATISHVDLDSTTPLGAVGSPYHSGEFLAVNLVYHRILSPDVGDKRGERFYTGIEYLYGQKETLDGSDGDAHRILFLVALRK